MMDVEQRAVGWRSTTDLYSNNSGVPSYDQVPETTSVPPWMVTFGDMMSLLLTFFIMLASFSELKSEEKYQALSDVFRDQFGRGDSQTKRLPGQLRPRNSALSKMATASRLKRTKGMVTPGPSESAAAPQKLTYPHPQNAKVASRPADPIPIPSGTRPSIRVPTQESSTNSEPLTTEVSSRHPQPSPFTDSTKSLDRGSTLAGPRITLPEVASRYFESSKNTDSAKAPEPDSTLTAPQTTVPAIKSRLTDSFTLSDSSEGSDPAPTSEQSRYGAAEDAKVHAGIEDTQSIQLLGPENTMP